MQIIGLQLVTTLMGGVSLLIIKQLARIILLLQHHVSSALRPQCHGDG